MLCQISVVIVQSTLHTISEHFTCIVPEILIVISFLNYHIRVFQSRCQRDDTAHVRTTNRRIPFAKVTCEGVLQSRRGKSPCSCRPSAEMKIDGLGDPRKVRYQKQIMKTSIFFHKNLLSPPESMTSNIRGSRRHKHYAQGAGRTNKRCA